MSDKTNREKIISALLNHFENNPNTSPLIPIKNMPLNGVTAAEICILRDDEKLVVTGENENGVLLSVNRDKIKEN